MRACVWLRHHVTQDLREQRSISRAPPAARRAARSLQPTHRPHARLCRRFGAL